MESGLGTGNPDESDWVGKEVTSSVERKPLTLGREVEGKEREQIWSDIQEPR